MDEIPSPKCYTSEDMSNSLKYENIKALKKKGKQLASHPGNCSNETSKFLP